MADRQRVKEFMRAQGVVGAMIAEAAADVMEAFERVESDTSRNARPDTAPNDPCSSCQTWPCFCGRNWPETTP